MRSSLLLIVLFMSSTFPNSMNSSITKNYNNWITTHGVVVSKAPPNEFVLGINSTLVPIRISTIDNQLAYISEIDFKVGDTITVTGITYPLKPNLIKAFTIYTDKEILFPPDKIITSIDTDYNSQIQTSIHALQDRYFRRNVVSGFRRAAIGTALTIAGVKIHSHYNKKEKQRHLKRLNEIAEMKANEVDPEDPDNDDWETPDEMITDLLEKLWYSQADVEYEEEMTLYSNTKKRNGLLLSSIIITSSITFICGLRDLNKAKKTYTARKEKSKSKVNISSNVSPTAFEITLTTSF